MAMYPQINQPTAPPMPYRETMNYNATSTNMEDRMKKFQYLVDRYEINREFATRLRALEGYEIVFIVDGKTHLVERKLVFSSSID